MIRRRKIRYHALNDLIAHSFVSAGIPVTKEPYGRLFPELMANAPM